MSHKHNTVLGKDTVEFECMCSLCSLSVELEHKLHYNWRHLNFFSWCRINSVVLRSGWKTMLLLMLNNAPFSPYYVFTLMLFQTHVYIFYYSLGDFYMNHHMALFHAKCQKCLNTQKIVIKKSIWHALYSMPKKSHAITLCEEHLSMNNDLNFGLSLNLSNGFRDLYFIVLLCFF